MQGRDVGACIKSLQFSHRRVSSIDRSPLCSELEAEKGAVVHMKAESSSISLRASRSDVEDIIVPR